MTEGDEVPGIEPHELEPWDPPARRVTVSVPRARRRLTVLAAAGALLVGAVALADRQGDDPPEEDDGEEDAGLDLEPAVLELAGPRDGNESIGLPLWVDPAAGLVDGQPVRVTGSGFVSGEGVGIVQCAAALPDQPGDAIDSCDIGIFTSITASSDGVATGEFAVKRMLTTPRTGTVDCLIEVGRCVVAMGALNDYDRSGVHEILFAGGEPSDPPPAETVPTATVSPFVELGDGDVVQLEGEGFVPGDVLLPLLCSVDPEVCWMLAPPGGLAVEPWLAVDGEGNVSTELQVWRFLPGPALGTYVDCAVSQCQLRLHGQRAPEPFALAFAVGGPPPTGATIGIEPDEDLAGGDPVTIGGAGFAPGAAVTFEICAALAGDPEAVITCAPVDTGDVTTNGDGSFSVDALVPTLGESLEVTPTTCGTDPGQCQPTVTTEVRVLCDGVETVCELVASVSGSSVDAGRPTFGPAPAPVTFRVG